ncbi:tigger transposable element-derived protein 1 [Biomphalaria glabrata]|nr:tigger transposable element-derived protein 1 [Biomphalaria glabrata]
MAPKRKPDSSDPKEKDAAKKMKAITMEVKVDIIRRSDKGGGNTNRNWQVITNLSDPVLVPSTSPASLDSPSPVSPASSVASSQ